MTQHLPPSTLGKRRRHLAPKSPDVSNIIFPDGASRPLDSVVSYGGGHSSFSGAKTSMDRGYVVFPTLDTRAEVSTNSRLAMLRRSRWLFNNVGFAKRTSCAISRMIGANHPNPQTKDALWKKEALAYFWSIAKSPLLFERSGKFNFLTYQHFLSLRWLIDGDMASIFTEGPTGATQIAAFEAHQISDPAGGDPLKGWFDGVKVDKGNRLQKIRITDQDHPDRYRDYNADVAHLTANWERIGQVRGVTPFHAAITRILDLREVTGDMMGNIKRSGLVGFYLHADDPTNSMLGSDGLAGGLRDYINEMSQPTSDGEDDPENATNSAKTSVKIEDLIPGMDGAITEMGGFEPKVLHDARPPSEQMNLLSWFIREASLSLDYQPEVLWEMAALNGNVSRMLKEEIEQTNQRYRDVITKPFCQRYWFHLIGGAIARGELREPEDGKWWDTEWVPPKKITIDRGNEGSLALEERRQPGMRTLATHYGELQKSWEHEADQWLDEIDYFSEQAKKRGWSQARIAALEGTLLAPPQGAAAPPDMSGPESSTDEESPEPVEEETTDSKGPSMAQMLKL